MTVLAMAVLPQLEVNCSYRQSDSIERHDGWEVNLGDNRRTPKIILRTASSPDRYVEASNSTTSAMLSPGNGFAVTYNSGSDDYASTMLADIKRMTGWRWERIAEAVGRSRQAVHGWTLGREISQPNLERLARLHVTLSYVDRGSAESNREALCKATKEGQLAADLLNAGEFDAVQELLGAGDGNHAFHERQRVAVLAAREKYATHWFDSLAETTGAEQPLQIVTTGERKRIAVRRKG